MGTAPEPRSGLRSGSIENSINVPYETLLNEDFTFKKKREILEAVLYLALDEIGCSKISLYDGSWAEWGKID